MPKYKPLYSLYKGLKESKYDVPDSYASFQKTLTQAGDAGAKSRRGLYKSLKESNYDIPDTYEDFYKNLFVPVNSTTSRALKIGENPNTPAVNRYHQKLFDSVDPNKNGLNALSHRAVSQAKRAMNNVRKPVTAKYVNREGKPIGEEFAITPAKTVEDLDREYAQETTKNWENELHDQMADADKDAAKISDMFKSFIGSTDEVGSVWGNMTRGGGIAGTPHSVTTNNGILENTEARQLLAAGDYNRKRKELLQLEQDSRNGATFDNHSFFRGMYDAAKDTGILTGGASDLINAGSLLATKQDLDNGVHTKAGDMLMQQAVKNSNAQSQYGDNQGWMYTGGVITTNMAPFMVQIGSAGFSKGISNAIGKVVQGAASKVALGTMEKATGMAGAHIANYIGKVTGLTTKAFGKAIQYGIVGAAQANTVGLGNVANDVINRYTGQVYQDEQGNYKFGTFDSDGNLVHEGGEDFLTAFVKGDAAQTIELATELAGGGIDAAGTALKNFVTNGGKKIINKYNMENVSKVIDFLLNNKVAKNARYLKAGADRTLGKVEVNSIVGESLEEELGIIANTVFTGDNKISDLWDEKQQSQIWGGMLLSIGLMKGVVAPFHAYNAKQYYSYKHKLNKADVNLSQLLGKEKWEELRNQIDATTNENMPEMVNKINRDVALGKNRQPVREYIQNLLIMRGYDIGNMLAAKKAVEDKGEGVSVKNMEKNQAYQQGRDAYGYDTHEIQLDQEDKQKSLAQLLGISEQQLASMSDEELESFSGRDDNIDRAIYDYQLSSARYEGVVDNARDQIDLEVQRAAQAVDMYTDKSRNTIRNATIKASGGLEDYGVYIISGNIATHDDGSIDVSNSDDMILYYDPTTNTVEHADAMMFAELGSEENADEVRSQAMADAKEKAIKETTGIIDGVVEVGTQFKTVDADGTEHTYEVLADNGDGTAMITIDGNVPTEIVKGENVQVPVSFEELQKMKDESDQQRLQAAKAQREQVEKERAAQQTQETEQTQPSFDFNQILNDDGNVVLADVLGKDGNTKYPNSQLFLIRDSGAKAKVVELTSDGSLIPHAVNKKDVRTATTMTLDEYKQAFAESSMIEDNSGENRGEIEVESPTIEGETAAPEATETPATEQTPAAPAITLEDGTIVPMLEDGNPDFSKLTAAQTAELYDTEFGEDADSIVSGYVSDAKKELDKANNMTVKGKTFLEQKAAKDAKEKAIADAQAAYDSAIAIRDACNERQLAKVEDTAEGRKKLIEKARRKFARLKSAVKDDAEAVAQIYKETVGSLLHRLYDGTGIDVTDTIPLTAEEYVASNLGAHSLNYEGTETSKSVKQETGLSREDFAKTQLLAADGKGTTIDALVHSLWENRPSNLDSLDTQDIRNALIGVLTSGFKASEARSYVENIRIAQAEKLIEEERTAAENAAYYEQQKANEEEEKKKAEEEKTEDNENTEFPDKLKEGSNAIEVPEDATDENPLGLQLSEDKVPFEIEGGKSGETYNINDDEDRQRLINDNKVDDKDILDIDMPKHVHKAIKELCKKMGLKVQFLYMGARSNGWIENGTMYLALDTEKATQFVFGHEMTHAIKQKNPDAYKELVKVAVTVTTRKKFEEDLAKVYQNYHGISGYNNVDDYVEEVVADNLGKFINDFDLAQKFSLRLNHPVLATILHAIQKIKSLLYGDFYKSVDALERIVEKAYVDTAKGEVTNSETGEDVSFSLRQKPEPKKKGIGYKVFVLKDGKLYPPMVANPDGAATPVGVWLDADAAPIAGESKTGRPQVKQGGKGTQGGSGKLAYRPGWHLGVVPYAIQFNRKDAEGNKTLFPANFVFAEVEYAADVDYQEEARQEGINPSGKYQHSLAGLKHLPTDGYYMYRTNPNPETDPWVITGAMKVNRILTRAEQAELVKSAGREPQQIQEGDIVTDDVVNSINQEIAAAPKFSLKVYHGSGADFTEFDFDHMGEGAGSQAFGWGGYVTSSKKIGKSYANLVDANAPHQDVEYVGNNAHEYTDVVAGLFNGGQRDYDDVKEFLQNGYNSDKDNARKKQMLEWFESTKPSDWKSVNDGKRNLYEVDIPDDNGSNYLDWDAPITDELIDKVVAALPAIRVFDIKNFKKDRSFEDLYRIISMRIIEDENRETNGVFNDDKEASKLLASLGYTGIKYKAGRNFGGAEEGDTNYVIFKPENMKIIEHTKFSLRLKSAIEETETNPSDAQKESGNYKKGHIKFGGYDYTIENPKGSTRSGKDANGKEWKVTMHDTYGYIRGKFGKDGDHLDMFINDKADLDNWDGDVFVVDQVNPDGSFDEHKVMYGYDSMNDAEKAYLANYSKGWKGLGNITGASKDEFDKWLDTSNRKLKPFADYAKVKFSQAQSVSEPRYSFKDIKPVGVGAFGNIYNQFRGKAKAAIEFLKKLGSGEATAALHHHTIGDISLVWGDKKTGLDKILRKHPEVVDNLQSIIDSMEVVQESDNRIKLESPTHFAVVSKEYKGEPREQWLLTAYEKRESLENGKSMDTATSSLGGDTALSQSKESAAKIDNSSETAKENGEKFSLKDDEYLKAVENGDMEKAQKMVNEAAEAAGYSTDSSYQGTSAFNGSAPWGNGYFLTKEERKEAWDNDEYDGDQTLGDYIHRGIDAMNLDFIALDPRNYRAADPMRKEAIDNVRNAIQKKSETITMYRSVPSDVKEGSFRNGDWVTPSRAYAVENAKVHGWGDNFNIIEQKVPVDEIWWDGNDIAEWGYGREEDYVNDTDFAYKNTKNNRKLLDAVTYDDNGNVIPLSQRFNENNADVRYSLKDEKTMFGMHNISLDKLRKAIKQGGFAAPSMGVIDSKNGIYSGYGEITLIPKAEKIAKRTGKNIGTYAADAWTPIYPPVEKKFGGNGGDVAYDDIESVPKEMQRLTRNAINSFMDGREANGLDYLYLQEKGKAPELVHVEGKYPKELHDEVKGILGKLNSIYNTTDEQKEKLLDLFIREVYDGNKEEFDNDIKKFIKKDEEFIKKRPNSNIAKNKQLDVDWMKEHGYDYGALSRFVDGILRDAETSGKVDENATMKAAQQYIQDKGMKEDFDSWKEKLNDRYNVEEVIFAGYKPDGNRKYLPNTVENAVKVMKQDGKNASVGSASFSHFVASILKPMGTLDQIRNKKGNLTGNYEDVEKFQEKWQPVYDELADKMQPDAEPFESYGMDRLEEVATQKNPKKYAKEEYGVDLTDEDINKLNELIEAVKNDKPSIYFETKFMRPYGLDEFEKAIVPNDTPSDVVDALKMAGIDVSSYERGNAEDRQKVTMDAINSSDNIRFSLKSMMAKPEGWKQANKKAIHIAEAIERDPKFSLKNLDGTLIKAGTYFSGGGLVEEGLKGIIDPVVAVEYDEKISGVYRNNFGQHIVTADVRDVDPKELVKQIDGEVEYFHASPVCKNYSQAKSNHAEVELDKETAASTAEFINAVKPKVVTIENVKGYKDSDAMKTITDALDANGYTWDADVYNAADYGGYTNRERLIVRAVRDGKLPAKPEKMAHKSGWYEAVADIIPTLTEKKNGVAPWMDIRLKADGIDWRNIDKPLYVMGSAYADGKIPHAFADELLPTLRTKSGDVIVMPDGKVYRAMGRVLARVSGVSDDYKMPFSENLSHTIIGNGIPTQLTEHVIAPLLTGSDPKFSIRTYHGTGAKFDKFDLSHALEGEGSESFGHGVYVTNSSKIGREYAQRAKQRKMEDLYKNMRYPDGVKGDIFKRRVFSEMVNDVATGGSVASAKEFAKKRVGADANDIQRTLENLKDREKGTEYEQNLKNRLAEYKEGLKWIDSLDEDYLTQGNVNRYDVDIPDDNGDYIDWENKLKKSHLNKVNKELVRIGKEPIETIYPSRVDGKVRGQDLYDELSSILGSKEAASKLLSDAGFVGIKYPAGMIHGGAEKGDYNYVIFDENNANIVGSTRFSLRYDQFEHDLNQWKKDNNLPKDAQRPTIPQRNAGESAVDFLRRVDEYRKQMALWKTAPTYEQHLLSDDTALGEFNRELQKGSVLKRIAFQDSMLAIRKAQEAIMKEVGVDRLNMAEDAYTAENRSHGKGKNEFEEYNNEFLQPLRKAYHQMKKVLGDSYDNVRIYMMAKHGLERDAQMAFKKSLEADYEDVAQRSAAYKAYKGDMNRIINDSDLEFGRVDFTTWRQRDNALRAKYSPSYMNYRYDKMGIANDYSGLSALFDGSDFEEAAHKLIKDIESKYVTETHKLWDATNAATKKILRDGYKAGMMSKDTYQYVRDMYSHYIPLRGWDGTTADQVWDYIGGGKGAFNQTLKTAHGRTSIADDPIAYIENMAESGILLNNKNWVKQHLMLLAQNHPTSLLTLSKAWYVKSTDANGNEEWIPATPQITSQMDSNQVKAAIDAFEQKMEQMAQTGNATQKRDGLNIAYPQTHSEEREHEVRVMKDGEEYVIYVNGDPQLAQAMNNTRAHRVREIQSGKLDRAAAWLGRKMAAAYTSLSPLFIPSNYFRDLTMTLASTAIREDGRYNYLLRKNLATSWNLGFMLRDYQNGKLREKVSNGNATPKEQMFYDFMMNGGETGFVSSLDVEDLKKKFKNDLKDLDRWKTNPVKVGHTIMDGIEFLNRAIEDSNRFAVYMTSIQYGRSIDEAVNDAKDVTLNFNRKGTGEYGWQMIRNLYLFINPAVQSLQTLGALVKHHPFKFTAVTAAWLASGVLVPIVNAALMSMLGGDDDKDKYWQFTKWDRRNNLIMWVPFTHEYIKIPLAQEFRAFYGIGDMIASKMMGGELAEESWSQYAEDLLGQVVDMLPLDPTGYDGNIAVSLMPNAIRPVFELAFNVDFTGKPLFKETEYNKYDPNFTKAYVGTPDWLVRASKMVNSIGNDYPDVQQNSIDAFGDPRYNLNNPAVVDHVLSSYLGGAYTMGSQVLGVLTKSLNDPKEIKVADIPLFSKFVSNPDDRPVTKKQGDEFWNMKENHDRAANTLSKLKKQAKVDGDYSMLERFYGSEEYKQYKQDDVKVKKYEEDKKKERAEESGEEYRPHKLNVEDIYKAYATPKDDFEDLKLKQLYTKLNGFKSAYDLLVDTAPNQSEGYYNTNKAAIDAIDEISLDKQEISELKKGFLDDGKDAYNAEDMKQIRELRKKILSVLEKANKVVVANQKAKAKKK